MFQGHIPRFVGIGALLLATGTLLFSVPHFIASPLTLNDTLSRVGELAIKVGNTPAICVSFFLYLQFGILFYFF